jgi:hypothetical protein
MALEEVKGEEVTPDQPGSSGSIIDTLRREYAKAAEEQTLDLEVPGWDGLLVARYHIVDGKQLGMIGDKVTRQHKSTAERNLYATIDSMLLANEGLFFKDEDGELHDIDPNPTERGFTVTYSDPVLLDVLGIPREQASTAREAVIKAFKGNEIAVMRHGTKLSIWMGDTSKDVNEGFLGDL